MADQNISILIRMRILLEALMGTRTELPWNRINKEVTASAKRLTKTQFVSTKKLADYVRDHPEEYPLLNENTHKCTISRITMSMNRMGWPSWSTEKPGGKQKVFIIPEGVRA
jgi:hypothetical protein